MQGLPKFDDPNLIVGAEDFSDAGVYRLRDDLLIVQSVDFFPPLVDDPFVFGQIAATNSMSDVFAMGGQPTTALNIVAFPDDCLEMEILQEILRGGAERIQQAGGVLVGGHSVRDAEIKYGLCVTGVVTPERLLTNREAQPGDVLVLTKALGTGFVTTAFKKRQCPDRVLETAVASMTQLNAVGRDAAASVTCHAATDITGFGLAGHASEVARASKVTVELTIDALPILEGAEPLAEQGYHTRAIETNRSFVEPMLRRDGRADATKTLFVFEAETSGGLLLSVPPDQVDDLLARAVAGGAARSCVVGQVTERQDVPLVLIGQ